MALAGAGCLLAVTGALVLSFDGLDGGDDGGGGSQLPGLFLSLAVLAAGVVLLTRTPPGPLRAAGSVATVAAIPPLLFFITFDDGSFPPYSTEAILGVSAAAWLVLHAVGPAAGRPLPLGAGLVAAWLFVLQVVEEPFTSPFGIISFFAVSLTVDEDDFGPGSDPFDQELALRLPDLETMALLSLAIGVAVVVAGRMLDRRGQRGRGTAVAAASLPMLLAGALLLVAAEGPAAGGLALVAAGGWVAYEGATRGRRLSCWAGALGAVVGVGMVVGDAVGDTATGFGIAAILAGTAIVALAHLVSDRFGEADELAPGPSSLTWQPSSVGPPPSQPPTQSPWAP